MVRRLALTAVGSVGLVALGTMASFVTTWPKWLSMSVEPFSLLLLPGVFSSMIFHESHDYVYDRILKGSSEFYVVVLYMLLWRWDRWVVRRRVAGSSQG